MKDLSMPERKVLTILEENSRMPANQIAKKCRLSTEGVIKIIHRLRDIGLIKRFNTKINYSRLGYRLFPMHVKLLKVNAHIIKEIKSSISRHKTCTWYAFCEGEYDLLMSFKIRDEKEMSDMKDFLSEISDNIIEKETSIVTYAFEISKSFLPDDRVQHMFPIYDHYLGQAELSIADMKIINLLKADSRCPIIELAKKIGLSARVISSKIRKLQKQKVISGFKTKINTAVLNYQPCIALISMGKHSEKESLKFMTYCQQKKGINYLVRQIGKYDIELTIDASNINEFYRLIDDIREEFPFIKKITTLIAKETS